MWSRTFGGEGQEGGLSIGQTNDGGYIMAESTSSFGAGNYDLYVVKTDAIGSEMWSQTFGGEEEDRGESVQQTRDGGYIIAGYTDSFGAGGRDVYLVKLAPERPPVTYLRGHTNSDGTLDIADAICILTYLSGSEGDPCKDGIAQCLDDADANDDGAVDIADAVAVLGHLFGGAGPLPEPFGACGVDPTLDELGCESYVACE